MSFEDERKAIESRMQANWATTPIQWENVPFAETQAIHVKFAVVSGEGSQASLGDSPRYRWPGLISIKIMAPENTGTVVAMQYADSIGTIFRRQAFAAGANGRIICGTPSVIIGGIDKGWYQVLVLTPFSRDKVF